MSQGTPGTTIALTTATPYQLDNLEDVFGTLFFNKNNQVWISDGTVPSTAVFETNVSFQSRGLVANGYYYWVGYDGTNQCELWRTDGSSLIEKVDEINNTVFSAGECIGRKAYTANGYVIYAAYKAGSWGLYSFPDTSVTITSTLLDHVLPGSNFVYNSKLYFAGTKDNESELWVTDGTPAGTHVLKDINTFSIGSSRPEFIATNSNNLLLFYATSENHGREIWQTDGTAIGTQELFNSNSQMPIGGGWGNLAREGVNGLNNSVFQYPTNDWPDLHLFSGTTLAFFFSHPFWGDVLATFNTATDSFDVFKDFLPGENNGPKGTALNEFNDRLFFNIANGDGWNTDYIETDLTPTGNHTINSLWAFDSVSAPVASLNANQVLRPVNVYYPDPSVKFYVYDTATHIETPISLPCADPCAVFSGYNYHALGSRVVYVDDQGTLYITDGTVLGTTPIAPSLANASLKITEGVELGGKLLFVGGNDTVGWGLWATDGTTVGTELLKLAAATSVGGMDYQTGDLMLQVFKEGSKAYFQLGINDTKLELYATDGTNAGTSLIKSFTPTTRAYYSSSIDELSSQPIQPYHVAGAPADTFLFFVGAWNATHDTFEFKQGWVSNGTSLGTFQIFNLSDTFTWPPRPVWIDSSIILGFNDQYTYSGDIEYERTYTPRSLIAYDFDTNSQITLTTNAIGSICNYGGRLYFSGFDASHGLELWYTDGSLAGTQRFQDSVSGVGSSYYFDSLQIGTSSKCYFWNQPVGQKPSIQTLDF